MAGENNNTFIIGYLLVNKRSGGDNLTDIISGRNAVLEALKAGLAINKVMIAENIDGNFAGTVMRLCRENHIPVRRLPKAKLNQIAGPDNRGVAAELAAMDYASIQDILDSAASAGEPPLVVLLDGIEDPHNLGAIIRSAYCLGAHGVVIGSRRAAQVNETVMKTSAGAAALLPVARVNNLNQALDELKNKGCWAAAIDMDGESLWKSDLSGGLVLVMGSEGAGISPLLKRNCDMVISIPMQRKEIGSLNVSNAAALLLCEAARQKMR